MVLGEVSCLKLGVINKRITTCFNQIQVLNLDTYSDAMTVKCFSNTPESFIISLSVCLFVCLSAKFVFVALVLFDRTMKNIMVVVAWMGWTTVDYFPHHIKSNFSGLLILVIVQV